ncbi:MAG: Holliday junction branch migration protein RuvA [Myxococcota bacterium]
MIGRLRGQWIDEAPGQGVVDVNGVGYLVFAPARAVLAWQGEPEVTVHIRTQVREDAITLYGFSEPVDRDAFDVLLTVNGVGPRMALATLDTLTVTELAQAVQADDVLALSRIPGIGRKKAQRLALELKGKLPSGVGSGATPTPRPRAPADDLPLALAQLQYGKTEIDRALAGLAKLGIADDAPLQERLAGALRVLAGGAT